MYRGVSRLDGSGYPEVAKCERWAGRDLPAGFTPTGEMFAPAERANQLPQQCFERIRGVNSAADR